MAKKLGTNYILEPLTRIEDQNNSGERQNDFAVIVKIIYTDMTGTFKCYQNQRVENLIQLTYQKFGISLSSLDISYELALKISGFSSLFLIIFII